MSYTTIGIEYGKNIPNREKYLGRHLVSLVSTNFAFGLVGLAFHDLKEIVSNITESDEAHIFLYEITERGLIKKDNNSFNVEITEANHFNFDDGPNHCGLRLETIKWYKPTIFEWVKSKFKIK